VEIMPVTFPLSCINENNIPFQLKMNKMGGRKGVIHFTVKYKKGSQKNTLN
jgi:hypothetical protein